MIKTAKINAVFNDLDGLRQFCVEYGHPFNEKDLYNDKARTYRQFCLSKTQPSKVKNNWVEDSAKFGRNISLK